jgi:predicted transcriptional regulator
LRQEYVWLTGDYKKAILLEYFLSYHKPNDCFNLSYETISNNSLLGFTAANLRKHIKHLIDKRWIERKSDETLKVASTFKYKVNKEKIEKDVEALLASF